MKSVSQSAFAELQRKIGYQFKNKALMEAALTHSSTGADHDYERLEFLGDRILNLVMAHEIYNRFPRETEGDLAKRHAALVQGKVLSRIARKLNLSEAVRLSEAERIAGGANNDNILADCVESLLGAIFLDADGNLDQCRRLILELWGDDVNTMKRPPRDSKTALQEWAQARGLALPAYNLVTRDGPDHAPVFEVEVIVEGFSPARCRGASRRKAEKEAAAMLLTHLEEMGA